MSSKRKALRRAHPDDYELHLGTYRDGWWLWLSRIWPSASSWVWPALYCLSSYIRGADSIVDGPNQNPAKQKRALEHVRLVLDALGGSRWEEAKSTEATDSDAMLVWLVHAANEHGVDILTDLTASFEAYAIDGVRIIEGRSIPTEEEYAAMLQGDYLLGVVYCLIGGIDRQTSEKTAGLVLPFIFWSDTLFDLADDVQDGRLNFPESACPDLSLTALLACNNWQELGQVPGFVDWYAAQSEYWSTYWAEVAEPEIQKVLETVPSAWRRTIAIREFRYHCQGVTEALENCRTRYKGVLQARGWVRASILPMGARLS